MAVAVLLGLGACDAAETRERGIEGQWALEMVRTPSTDSGGDARGVLVFGGDLRAYPGPPRLDVDPPYVAGRSYVDMRSLWGLPVDEAYVFSPGPDVLEEAVAKMDGDSVSILLAPHAVGGRTELRGVVRADGIRGSWIIPAHRGGTGAGGTFSMIRVPADAFTDSARARSRRILGR